MLNLSNKLPSDETLNDVILGRHFYSIYHTSFVCELLSVFSESSTDIMDCRPWFSDILVTGDL